VDPGIANFICVGTKINLALALASENEIAAFSAHAECGFIKSTIFKN
jgi:hypothetical protein